MPQLLIFRTAQINERRHGIRKADSLPIQDFPFRSRLNPSLICKQHIQIQVSADAPLSMITDQHQIYLFQKTAGTAGFHQSAKISIQTVHCLFHPRTKQAIAMAICIKCPCMDKAHIWFFLSQDIAGYMDIKIINYRPLHKSRFAALLPPFRKITLICFNDFQHFLRRSGIRKAASQSVPRLWHPILCHQPVHIRISRCCRPGNGSSCITGLFCCSKQILYLISAMPEPVLLFWFHGKSKITGQTVSSRITASNHRNMGWISNGGVYRTHPLRYFTASCQIFPKIRQLF